MGRGNSKIRKWMESERKVHMIDGPQGGLPWIAAMLVAILSLPALAQPASKGTHDWRPGTASSGPSRCAVGNPEPQSAGDKDDPGRNVWSTPLSGWASALGLTALFAGLGLNDSVAAAVGGVALVLPLLLVAFFGWQFVRRRRVLNRNQEVAGPRDSTGKQARDGRQ